MNATQTPKRYANIIPMKELLRAQDQLNPFPVLEKLRKETPVRYDSDRECWDVFLYEDVHKILQDPASFSSSRGLDQKQSSMLMMDPPQHTQMRNLVSKAFTPKAVQDLAPKIDALTHGMVDAMLTRGEIDIVEELATPLPVIVIAEMLGVPAADRKVFKEWSDILVSGPKENTDEAFMEVVRAKEKASSELHHYFRQIIADRRRQPQDDLVTSLLQSEIDGEKLTEDKLLGFCLLLLVAGNETTTNLITNAVRVFTEYSDVQDELRRDPSKIPSAVEEVLRYYPPVVAIGRTATKDLEIRGQQIQRGQQVVSWIASANRDEHKFDDPNRFIIGRKPNAHLSFGFGIHFCLGAPLARLEAQIALGVLLEKTKQLTGNQLATLTPIQSPFVYGVKAFPVQIS